MSKRSAPSMASCCEVLSTPGALSAVTLVLEKPETRLCVLAAVT